MPRPFLQAADLSGPLRYGPPHLPGQFFGDFGLFRQEVINRFVQ